MDEELVSYLDKRFDESDRRMRRTVEETTRQIVGDATRQIIGETTRQIVGETTRQIVGETTRLILGETTRLIDGLRQETAERFEKVDTEIRHTRVLIEDLRSDLKAVAEGVVNVNEKLDRHIEKMDRQRAEDQAANRVVFSHHQERLDDHEARLSGLESARV